MDISVCVQLDSLELGVKQILTIACHNHAEIMVFVMIQSQVIRANVRRVTLDSRAKRTSTIVNHRHVIVVHALMATIHSHANAIQDIQENCAKHRSMNANQVS